MMNKPMIGIPAEIYIEHTCDFADQIMQDRLNRSYEDYLLGIIPRKDKIYSMKY
jgi:hypothetical protein